MQFHSVNRNSTFFQNDFIEAYYSDKLADFSSYKPNLSELSSAIENRLGFEQRRRDILVSELFHQYNGADIKLNTSPVGANIEKLKSSKTFTITTGQQIHIGLGPLYVLYKIVDVLTICREAKELNPDYNFVPVFWMASEDHDLEEIQSVKLYKNEFLWDTAQFGPVGRMNTKGISELFQTIENQFNLSENQLDFLVRCKDFYSNGTVASGFRNLLHSYFGEEGLIILDADSEQLKLSVAPMLEDELLGKNGDALKETSKQLSETGFKPQLVVRDTNVFWISKEGRSKVKLESGKILSEEGSELCAIEDVFKYVQNNAQNISPNAALRPLYQEMILPNLVYVGGGSEMRYWHQLKGLFQNYTQPLPLLHLRTSNVVIPEAKLKPLDLNVEDLFKSENELMSLYSHDLADVLSSLEKRKLEAENALELYEKLFAKNVAGRSITTRLQKIKQRIAEVDKYAK
ncbi:MAG: bacillithiol biosynthesis BshC, partial [Bacteroidia bacterium]|nr:bacillithiol biosynthesis BshC [Bacteroidia bacterium]